MIKYLFILILLIQLNKSKLLLIIDNNYLLFSHKTFISDLQKSQELVILNVATDKIDLEKYDLYFYESIVLMCSSFNINNQLQEDLKKFFDKGNNLVIAADIDTSANFRKFLLSLGIQLDPQGNQLFDHFNHKQSASIVSSDSFCENEQFVSSSQSPLLYRGSGLSLTIYENSQQYTIASGGPLTISVSQQNQVGNVGSNIVLVAAIQGRTNGRVVVTGSVDMFSNELYQLSAGANQQFVNSLLQWGFNQKGKLRVTRIFHARKGEQKAPFNYRVGDDARFEIDIQLLENGKWTNFDTNDLQIEFIMLDPYIRTTLEKIPNTPTFYLDFKVPDQYGVFKFQLQYRKPGYTFLDEQVVAPVRPYKHNEFDRYLFQAYPYYIGVWGTFAAFLVFIFFFIFHKQ